MNYGEKISQLRKSRRMTQEELGKVLNVTYQAVSKWERNESLPDFETMSQIAKYFQVPLSYFEDGGVTAPDDGNTHSDLHNVAGTCTVCGRLVTEDRIYESSPKIVCNECAQRIAKEKETQEKREKDIRLAQRKKEKRLQRGDGVDAKLIIQLLITAACYVAFTVLYFTVDTFDKYLLGLLLFIVPLAVFGIIGAIYDFIDLFRDRDDGPDGYTRNVSLIVAGAVALVNAVCFLVLFITSKENYYLIFLIGGAVLAFTFVSQFAWGGVVKDIFTAGGFTFKLPGFIISLTVESILWMIITKLFLGIIAAALFVVTTVIMAVVAIIGSVILFIPSVITKTIKDKKA